MNPKFHLEFELTKNINGESYLISRKGLPVGRLTFITKDYETLDLDRMTLE